MFDCGDTDRLVLEVHRFSDYTKLVCDDATSMSQAVSEGSFIGPIVLWYVKLALSMKLICPENTRKDPICLQFVTILVQMLNLLPQGPWAMSLTKVETAFVMSFLFCVMHLTLPLRNPVLKFSKVLLSIRSDHASSYQAPLLEVAFDCLAILIGDNCLTSHLPLLPILGEDFRVARICISTLTFLHSIDEASLVSHVVSEFDFTFRTMIQSIEEGAFEPDFLSEGLLLFELDFTLNELI